MPLPTFASLVAQHDAAPEDGLDRMFWLAVLFVRAETEEDRRAVLERAPSKGTRDEMLEAWAET